MAIFDLFSKRQKRLRSKTPDVYQYDSFPNAFRVQVIHIWRDAFGTPDTYNSDTTEIYQTIHDALAREYGLFALSKLTADEGYQRGLVDFFLNTPDPERVLDVIELSFSVVDNFCRQWEFRQNSRPKIEPKEAIGELNVRFREHGIGYQFESGKLIRVDSTVVHNEIVRPALHLLSDPAYAGANAEFLAAHENYRHGKQKECLNDALKALESTLKSICQKRGWPYAPTDTAKKLLDICFSNGLIEPHLQAEFSALRSTLESGAPTLRNKLSGHGQGVQPVQIPPHVAAYGLHLTASSIVFLINAERVLP